MWMYSEFHEGLVWDARRKMLTSMEMLVMETERAGAAGSTRSGVWDMLSPRCLFRMYVERSRGRGWMSLVFREEVWATDVNFGVVSGKMVFKAKKLDELTRE